MTVNLKFYDADTNAEISLDKITGGYNFGIVRKGQQSAPKGIIIKNLGTDPATGLQIKGATLDSSLDVPTEEYNKQLIASTWKWFSFFKDKNFTQTLSLPNIPAGGTLIGKKEIIDDFANPSTSSFKNDSLATHIWSWTGTTLKFDAVTSTSKFAYAKATGWGNNKDYECIFNFSHPVVASYGGAFVVIGLRMNSNADGKGYLLVVKRQKTTTTDTVRVDLYHGVGVTDTGAWSATNLTISSSVVNYVDYAPMRIKIFNNASGNPEIKIWYNAILDTDQPLTWTINNVTSNSWQDSTKMYLNAGETRIEFGGAGVYEVDNAYLLTDDPNGKIYVKTIVGDGAEDNVEFKSSLELFYDPVV